ncbi:MAG TPA: ABC transporter substrate-binding protein, partial [Casimicrobiaceae bacterium]|nr:ABC transporter substrate-binding protein [Casimicrobiaceae bacterium]
DGWLVPRTGEHRGMKIFVALALLVVVTLAEAQAPPRLARIGFLTPAANAQRESVFRDELAKLGWVEGRNLSIDYRNADGQFDRLPALAQELVKLNPDLIVTVVTQASVAAKAATTTIPIVIVGVGDPVGAGIVASFARPGGNITGNSGAAVEIVGKQLELLREVKPSLARVVALWNPTNRVFQQQQLDEANAAATRMRVKLDLVEATRPDALDAAFAEIAKVKPDALIILADPMFGQHAQRIAQLAVAHRLPSVSGFEAYTEAGILIAYGTSFDDYYQRAARYVDRILKGAKPADLPIERPTRFELMVNQKTAKALGIVLPPALVARADRVIQ